MGADSTKIVLIIVYSTFAISCSWLFSVQSLACAYDFLFSQIKILLKLFRL